MSDSTAANGVDGTRRDEANYGSIGPVTVPPLWALYTVDDAVWLLWLVLLGVPAGCGLFILAGYSHPLAYRLIVPFLTLAGALAWAVYLSPAARVDLSDDIVLITGGLGLELSRKVIARGAVVVVLTQHEAEDPVPGVKYYLCDVSNRETVRSVAEKIRKEVGEPTIIVNNAGVVHGKLLLDLTEEDITSSFAVNSVGPFWVTQEYLPAMLKARRGHIVNISSVLGLLGVAQMTDYCASKASIVAFHTSLRNELDYRYKTPEIRTTLALPAHILTSMFTETILPQSFLLRMLTFSLTPSEVADAIVGSFGGGKADTVLRMPLFTHTARLLGPASALVPKPILRLSHWVSGADWSMTHYGPRPDAGQRLDQQRDAQTKSS